LKNPLFSRLEMRFSLILLELAAILIALSRLEIWPVGVFQVGGFGWLVGVNRGGVL
jgi:hypothetical protein